MKKSILFLSLVMLTFSCSTSKKAREAAQNKPLNETYWELKAIEGNKISEGNMTTPFIVLGKDGKYYGSLGCNRFFGEYFAKDKKISLKYAGSTKMMCPEMETEDAFSKAFRKEFSQYVIKKDTLILYENNKEILRFLAGQAPAEN
ncbi:MAG: META domain-containing protein [Bacteroidales bacterium]